MKFLVLIALCICISQTAAVSTEIKTKMSPKGNAIPGPQKTELYYPQTNHQTDFMPVHVMQKPLFLQQPQPQPQPAMLIIAQPAYVPQNVIYGNQAGMQQQQLLNYFHGNPQAKYQFLFGGYQPHPTAQSYIPQHQLPASTVPAYQIVPGPVYNGFNHLVGAPAPMNYNQLQQVQQVQQVQQIQPYQQNQIAAQYVQPMQLNQLAQLAQMTAHQFTAPIRSVPPIITGFENFTPEQQVQIKAQLGAHLGGQLGGANLGGHLGGANLGGHLGGANLGGHLGGAHLGGHLGGALTTATTAPATTSQYTSPLSTQPTQSLNVHDYMQNQDKHVPQGSASSFSPSLVYRAQYTKG